MIVESAAARCSPGPWTVASVDEAAVEELARALGISRVVARLLVARGIDDIDAARRFLEPDLGRDWHDPAVIPGMAAAAARVAEAVRAGEHILVFGDFDLDGVSSAAVLRRGLAALGAKVDAIVPHRFRDGYGLTPPSVERILAFEPALVVTVDCGISSGPEVRRLLELGIDVVVTDHHEPSGEIPVGVPVADPKSEQDCPSRDLAGAGVALKLLAAVGALVGRPDEWRALTGIAMLGTVADIVSLVGENRALVAAGLKQLREGACVGIASLANVAGVQLAQLTAEQVAYALAPRLNAAGRMADPAASLRLLLTDDPFEAEELALELDAHNRARQATEQDLFVAASALAERVHEPGARVLVLAGEGWHEGVKGIVASRLARLYGVPVVLFAIVDGEARGSGRSVGTVDLHAAVASCEELLIRYGGHEAAVGVTLPVEALEAFRDRIESHMASLPQDAFTARRTADAQLDLSDVSVELAAEIDALEPFGHGNRRPCFVTERIFMNARQRVGVEANHLRFIAFDGLTSVPAIAFRCPDIEALAEHDAAVDVLYEISADSWRGRSRVQLRVRDVRVREAQRTGASEALVEEIFASADRILAREEYSGIEDAESFHTKLVGVTFEGRQGVIERLRAGVPLRMERQPDNEFDPNAIALFDPHGEQVGFLNRRLASVLAPLLDGGAAEYDVEVTDVTGGEEGKSRGVNIFVSRRADAEVVDVVETALARRQELAALRPSELDERLTRAFIGDRLLHDAQSTALAALARGERTLAVMATGRGKSLIFQLHACRVALLTGRASVLVYPLRALVNDQAFHLEEVLAELGLRVAVVTGESAPSVRDEVFAAITDGGIDIALTTPEFLHHHSARFAATGRIGFVVVDEAHHVATSRAGHRPAYARLGEAFDAIEAAASQRAASGVSVAPPLGVLAVTATAGDEQAAAIREALGIETVIVDPSVRDNLALEDRRGTTDKDDYVAALAAGGEKMVVYVNSRDQSVRIARMLRKRVPEMGFRVVFYNAGLSRSARHAVEHAFRDGDVRVVVATSAFGEGINIPDIRHVVLYHMPFSDIEFNQMSGRAGRDGAAARIHLLFGEKDARLNETILSSVAPGRDDMAVLYRVLRDLQAAAPDGFESTNAEIADMVRAREPKCRLNDRGVSSAVGVFRELGLVESEGYGAYRRLRVLPRPDEKTELTASVRYTEGLEEIAEFAEFREWALGATASELLGRFNRPILPSRI